MAGELPFGLAPSGELTAYQPTLRERVSDWLRQSLFTDDRAGQDKANRLTNWGETMIPPFGFATQMYDAGNQAGRGNYLGAGLTTAMAFAPGPKAETKGIRAFHGSPHSFDRFDMSKIGTGEGAQAYGHGLYFAENEGVAKGYRDTLAPAPTAAQDAAQRAITQYGDASTAADEIARMVSEGGLLPETVDHYKAIEAILRGEASSSPGSMYEVSINADPNTDFINFDAPWSEQPQKIKDAFHYLSKNQPHGSDLARRIEAPVFAQEASDRGVKGIKFLDAGSRGAGDGTRNFVVFDDKLISIIRKYGIAGASAYLGYDIMQNVTPAQAEELKKIEGK